MFYTMTKRKNIALRIAAFVLALVLALGVMLAAAPKVSASATDGLVRVRLSSYGSKSSYTLQVVGSYQVEGHPELLFCDGEKFTVTANGSNVVLRDAGGNETSISSSLKLVQRQSGKTNLLRVDSGYYYAGDMKVEVSGSSLLLTNTVYIETYLQGVLPYEMSNSWPIEALCAQAVAARTYVYSKMLARSAYAYDVVDTTSDQVYRGYDYQVTYSNCRTAIERTRGQVMVTASGNPITASYTASNGGMTEDGKASGATGSSQAYLPHKADSADLAVSLASGSSYSAKLYIPKEIDGAVLATSSTTSYKMLRTQMQAQGIDVENISHVTVTDINLQSPRNASYPDRAYTGADIVVDITYKDDTTATETLCFTGTKSGSVYLPFLNKVLGTSLSFRMLYLEELDDEFLLASVRFGHGTGMSQMGAKYRAQQGETYQQILGFYYECGNGGCSLSTKDWSAPAVSSIVDPALRVNATIDGSEVNFRAGAGTGYSVIDTLDDGDRVRVIYKAGDWYKIYFGGRMGFVSASYVDEDTTTSGGSSAGGSSSEGTGSGSTSGSTSVTTGKVTASTLYVRKGPGTGYSSIGYVRNGQTVTILKNENGWYQIKYGDTTGYVSADYIGSVTTTGGSSSSENTGSGNTTGGSSSEGNGSTSSGTAITTGTISATSLLVRSGAGTGYSKIGSLTRGTKVTLLEKTSNGWYRINYNGKTGYISGDYVTNITTTGGSIMGGTSAGGTTGGNTSTGGNTTGGSSSENTGSGSSSGSTSTTTTMTGTISATSLLVRSGAGTGYSKIGSLTRGTKVTLLEKTSNGWYRINYNGKTGYISGDYVTDITTTGGSSTGGSTGGSSSTGGNSSGNTTGGSSAGNTTTTATTGTVTASTLFVRSGAGSSYSSIGGLVRGDKVTILGTSGGWYQIKFGNTTGYVSSQYIQVSGTAGGSSSATTTTTATVTASSLYVRSGPGASYSIVGGVSRGQSLTVLKKENGWCQIKFGDGTGYVSADYLRMN